jgi:hypothetical protein
VVKQEKKSCVSLGMTESECDCQIEKMQRMVPYEEYKRRKAKGGNLPNEVMVEASRCVENQHRYPKGIVQAYITECIKGGGTYAQCECMIQQHQRMETYADFIECGLTHCQMSKDILDNLMACLRK